MPAKFTGLGRGLGSLIPQKQPAAAPEKRAASPAAATGGAAPAGSRVLHVPTSDIVANPEQPRGRFGHQELEDLTNSIREHGILQPLTVSVLPGGGYELIAGERRYRAAKMLGLPTVPVMVRPAGRDDKLILALIENIQRENLNALEEARAFERLTSEFGLTQETIAQKVGKARSTVANTLRLLDLPAEILEAVGAGVLSAGTARAMLSLPDDRSRLAMFRKIMERRQSTRQVEEGVRKQTGAARKDPAVLAAEEQLRQRFGTRVEVKKRGSGGSIAISFYSDEEYRAILEKLL
jgi:ParB family chromosome partitioning protein